MDGLLRVGFAAPSATSWARGQRTRARQKITGQCAPVLTTHVAKQARHASTLVLEAIDIQKVNKSPASEAAQSFHAIPTATIIGTGPGTGCSASEPVTPPSYSGDRNVEHTTDGVLSARQRRQRRHFLAATPDAGVPVPDPRTPAPLHIPEPTLVLYPTSASKGWQNVLQQHDPDVNSRQQQTVQHIISTGQHMPEQAASQEATPPPAVLMRLIKQCQTARQLQVVVDTYSQLRTYNALHASAALTHLAQMISTAGAGSGSQSGISNDTATGMWSRLWSGAAVIKQHQGQNSTRTQQAMPTPSSLSVQGTSPTGSHGQGPSPHQCVQRLTLILTNRVWKWRGKLRARQLSNVSWALSRLHSIGLLDNTPSSVQWSIHDDTDAPPRPVSQHTDLPPTHELVSSFATLALQNLSSFTGQELASLLYALAQLGYVPHNTQWLDHMLVAVRQALPSMTAQGLANSIWAFTHWLCVDGALPAATTMAAAAASATDQLSDSSGRTGWHLLGRWRVRVGFCDPHAPVATHATALLHELWRVSASHMPTDQDTPVAHHDPWPLPTLAVISWSCARMQVLPPTQWQAGLAAITFSHLEHMSIQDTCYLAWAAARWHQLADAASRTTEAQVWGWTATLHGYCTPSNTSSHINSHGNGGTPFLQPPPEPALCFLPHAWSTRLSARAADVLVHMVVSKATQAAAQGRNRSAAEAQSQPTPAGSESSPCLHATPSPESSHRQLHHPHAISMLLHAAHELPLLLPARHRVLLMRCMRQQPYAFTPDELITFAGLELSAAQQLEQTAEMRVRVGLRSKQHLASGLPVMADKPNPFHLNQGSPHRTRIGAHGPSSPSPSQHVQAKTPVNTLEQYDSLDRLLSPDVYQLMWGAARQLTHGNATGGNAGEQQQQRVALVQLLARMPQLGTATCRRCWRAVRVGLRVGGVNAYSSRQARQLLHAITQSGYHVPASDMAELLRRALQPLVNPASHTGVGTHTAASVAADAAWATVCAARGARVSRRHHVMLVTSPQARRQWQSTQAAMLALLQRHMPSNPLPRGSVDSHSPCVPQRAIGDSAAMMLWSFVDMRAPKTTRYRNTRQAPFVQGLHKQTALARSNPNHPSTHVGLPRALCVSRLPRLVILRGMMLPRRGNPLLVSGIRIRPARGTAVIQQVAPPGHPLQHHLSDDLIPPSAWISWVSTCTNHVPYMSTQAIVLLVSSAGRLPGHVIKSPCMYQAMMVLMQAVAERVSILLHTLSCGQLPVLALRMASLWERLQRLLTPDHAATKPMLSSPCLISQLIALFDDEWELRGARVTRAQAQQMKAALGRLCALQK